MQGDQVSVRIGEGERPAEGAVHGPGHDGVTVGSQGVVDVLDVGGVEPDGRTDPRLLSGVEIGTRDEVAQGEGDRLGGEDDGVRRSGR